MEGRKIALKISPNFQKGYRSCLLAAGLIPFQIVEDFKFLRMKLEPAHVKLKFLSSIGSKRKKKQSFSCRKSNTESE
jgi:hypothetical protein